MQIDQKVLRSIVNQMRGIEALGRVSKVMTRHLYHDIKIATELLDIPQPQVSLMNLRDSIDQFIETADELHEKLAEIASEHHIEVDEDDDGIIVVPQGGGPAK